MTSTFLAPTAAGPDATLANLKLVDRRSFMVKALKERGLKNWQPPTTAALLATWDLVDRPVFFDIGANIGIYALLHARRSPHGTTVAFEPTPDLVELGTSMGEINGVDVRWENVAVSDHDGEATLYLSARSDASNSLVEGFRRAKGVVTVPVTTVDSYVARSGIVPSVIKIDVESHEPAVLRGAGSVIRTHRPTIVVEMIPDRSSSAGARDLLEQYGYHGRHLVPPDVRDEDRIGHRDWLFWPDEAPAGFDDLFLAWSTALSRCTPQG